MSFDIIRVFPRRTRATPIDDMVFIGDPPMIRPQAKEVHVSCTFTWDKPEAERLAKAWSQVDYSVSLGGPAYNDEGNEFTPGLYLKPGMTITSRGCPHSCEFCFVPEREGPIRLLEIKDGWDVLDNNLLACPRKHIEAVMDMLARQPKPIKFTGGIEAARIRAWWITALEKLRLKRLYIAYDRPAQGRVVKKAIATLTDAGLRQRQIGCYVLVGFNGDCREDAERRLRWIFDLGATPFAMYFRGPNDGKVQIHPAWRALARRWSRPAAMFANKNSSQETLDLGE